MGQKMKQSRSRQNTQGQIQKATRQRTRELREMGVGQSGKEQAAGWGLITWGLGEKVRPGVSNSVKEGAEI